MSTPSGRTSILIALIGLCGVLGAAIISRPVSQVADTQRSIISGQDSGNKSSNESLLSIDAKDSNVQVGDNNSIVNNTTIHSDSSDLPPPPPNISAPSLTSDELFSGKLGPETGCYSDGKAHIMSVAKAGQEDLYSGNEPPHFFLVDESGIKARIHLDESISSATASWIPAIMVPGRKLKIRYAQCGNGGIKTFTYIEALNS
jgi:hypothetical protein